MSTRLASIRRLAVTIALSGVAAIGAVALAPAAMADDTAVVQPAPVLEPAPLAPPAAPLAPPAEQAPVTDPAPVVEPPAPVAPAPAPPAPVAQTPPVTQSDDGDDDEDDDEVDDDAPVVRPLPPVVVDKSGNEHKAPKYCTIKDLEDVAKKVAEATKQAAKITQTANWSRAAAALARKSALKMTAAKAKVANDVARRLDLLAGLLDRQATTVVEKAAQTNCVIAPTGGGRF